jgi:hypothetical protein
MLGAVRLVVRCPRPAEEEACGAGIADRPSAGIVAQFEEQAAPAARDVRVEASIFDIGLGVHHPGRQRAATVPIRDAISGLVDVTNRGMPSAGRAAEGRLIGDAEPVNLRDDGVGRDAVAQLRSDVPHPRALRPASPQISRARLGPRRHPASLRHFRQNEGFPEHHKPPSPQIAYNYSVSSFVNCQK